MPSSLPSFRLPLGLKCYTLDCPIWNEEPFCKPWFSMLLLALLAILQLSIYLRFVCSLPVNQFSTDEKGSRIYTPPQSISIPLDVFMSTFAQNLPLHILCLRSCIYLHIYTLVNLRQPLGTRHQEKSRKIPWMSGVRKWCTAEMPGQWQWRLSLGSFTQARNWTNRGFQEWASCTSLCSGLFPGLAEV